MTDRQLNRDLLTRQLQARGINIGHFNDEIIIEILDRLEAGMISRNEAIIELVFIHTL